MNTHDEQDELYRTRLTEEEETALLECYSRRTSFVWEEEER